MNRKQKVSTLDTGYNITVTGRHVQVTDGMKAHAIERISRLERIAPRIIDVNVIMDIQKIAHKVDIVMKYGSTLIKSSAVSTDMYVSIDQAVHKLEAQLKRYISRVQDHHAKKHEEIEVPEVVYAADIVDEADLNDQIEKENKLRLEVHVKPSLVVKKERQPLTTLTDQEAIMKMDLSLAPVLVFRDEATRKLKVIYRREDGNYGIIEAEEARA